MSNAPSVCINVDNLSTDTIKTDARVKFVRRIPENWEMVHYFDPDLMSVANNDPRITELFTEVSHHSNLSVITINQKLHYSKDPTVPSTNSNEFAKADVYRKRWSFRATVQGTYPHTLWTSVCELKPSTPERWGLLRDGLEQWFLTLLEALNLASFISAFTEPFVIEQLKYDFFKT